MTAPKKVVKEDDDTKAEVKGTNGLAEVLKKLKTMDFPKNTKNNDTWLKKDIKGLKGCQVCCTTPNHDLTLNIKLNGQRWGLFFNSEKAFEDFYELIHSQKGKIMKFLQTLEVVQDTVSVGADLEIAI